MIDPGNDETVSFVKGLIEKYKPAEPDFEIVLPSGETMRFRVVTDLTAIYALHAGARKFHEMMTSGAYPPAWEKYATQDAEVIAAVYAICELSVEPKISHYEGLMLAKEAGPVLDFIRLAIDAKQMKPDFIAVRDVEEKKSDSVETPSDAGE